MGLLEWGRENKAEGPNRIEHLKHFKCYLLNEVFNRWELPFFKKQNKKTGSLNNSLLHWKNLPDYTAKEGKKVHTFDSNNRVAQRLELAGSSPILYVCLCACMC